MGIYGLLLFPLVKKMTDFKDMNVFKSVVNLKINLAALVLAKTLSSLNHCKKTGKGTCDVVYNCFFLWNINHLVE
jgi:hypothetical protein